MLRSNAEIKTILKIPFPHTAIAKGEASAAYAGCLLHERYFFVDFGMK